MTAILEQQAYGYTEEGYQPKSGRIGEIVLDDEMERDIKTPEQLAYKELVPTELWHRLTTRIENDYELDKEMSQRVMNETLGFLKACADNPDAPLSPSEKVDMGWHTFLLYTKGYQDFSEGVAGRFIHHEPNDNPLEGEGFLFTAGETHKFLSDSGYNPDSELWLEHDMDDRAPWPSPSCNQPAPPNPQPRPQPMCGPGQPPR